MSKNVEFDIRAQDKTKAAFTSVKSGLGGITSGLNVMKGLLIGGGVVAGLAALKNGLDAVTSAAMVQREAETTLAAVLRSTGNAAGYNLEQLKKMASGFQDVTTFGDEAVLSGMSILATFKNIQGDAFERTTKAALDMSTVMKQDLKPSMVMLGKAINDPLANLSALSRAGVQFTKEQKALIKEMVLSGDLMEAQGLILEELESQFGGAAEAAGGPFAKALGQLKNVWGDLLEEIGFAITDNEAFIEVLQRLKGFVVDLIPVIGNLVDDFIDWIGPADAIIGRMQRLYQTFQIMIYPIKAVYNWLKMLASLWGQTAGMIYTIGENLVEGDSLLSGVKMPSFDTGTGPAGLQRTGPVMAHQGEVILNQSESDAYRRGAAGGINITISPRFMTGDAGAARAVAAELKRALGALDHRWGAAY